MSNELTTIVNTDITESEMVKINKYIEDGLPGISNINETQLYRMYELYLTGSTYTQIASTLQLKKVIVLYLAHHSDWYTSKKEYLDEIQEKIKNRVTEAKLRSKEFLLLSVQAWQKRIGHKLTRYLSTNDEGVMDDVDLKEVTHLMKVIEMIGEMDNTGKGPKDKVSPIGLNIGGGFTMEKTGDNKISITPNEPSIGDVLKDLADKQKDEEKKMLTSPDKSDINIKQGE
jgi:hypothetical protein